MSALSERALLATLNISMWTGHRLDRQETESLNRSHGINVEAARVNKRLLPVGLELKQLQQTTGAIRKAFDARTLPWGIDGVRILKSDTYIDFSAQVNAWQDDWERDRDAFLTAYPGMKDEARRTMGSLYKEEDYPTARELCQRFGFGVRFYPVPDAGDFRVDVSDLQKQKLEADLRARITDIETEAMKEAYGRVQELVEKTVERLATPENVFRDSLVDNAAELCRLLPGLNISNDPTLEEARKVLERSVAKHAGNVDTLRHDPLVRAAAAKQLADIQKKMAGYFPKAA